MHPRQKNIELQGESERVRNCKENKTTKKGEPSAPTVPGGCRTAEACVITTCCTNISFTRVTRFCCQFGSGLFSGVRHRTDKHCAPAARLFQLFSLPESQYLQPNHPQHSISLSLFSSYTLQLSRCSDKPDGWGWIAGRLRDPFSLLSSGYRGYSNRSVKLITRLNLVPRSETVGYTSAPLQCLNFLVLT